MLSSAGVYPLALCTARKSHRTIDSTLKIIPAPEGAEFYTKETLIKLSIFHRC